MSIKTLFNINGDNRVINPRNGSDQFVDLVNNQTISGIKRFLNNFITNSNVNFNRTDNIGRVVIQPNNYAGTFMGIYTDSENTGTGWIYDANGDFYYQTGGIFNNIQWKLDALGNLNIVGNLDCDGNTTLETLTINGLTMANDINIASTKVLNTNTITSTLTVGFFQTKIALSNTFIDANTSSLDIIASYIGIAHPSQTLTTSSKYLYFKPLSTGDFQMILNNISGVLMSTDWATLINKTQWRWDWYSTGNVLKAFIDPNATGSNPIISVSGGITGGLITASSISSGSITSTGITLNGVLTANDNIIMLSSKYLQTNLIRPVTSTGFQTSIMMDNRFINTDVSSLDLRGQYIGISHPFQTLNTSIKMVYIAPATTGNFDIYINNIANKIIATDWGSLSTKTQWKWNFHSTADVLKIFIDPNATGTNPFLSTGSGKIACGALSCTGIDTTSGLITTGAIDVTGNITMANPANATLKTTSVTSLECNGGNITGAGSITCNSLNANSGLITTTGNISGAIITGSSLNLVSGQIDCGIVNNTAINTSGTITTNNINPYSASTISSTGIWNYKSGSNINIFLNPITTTQNRLQIYGVSAGTKFLYYSINDVLALFNTSTGNVWSIGSTGIISTTDYITTTSELRASSHIVCGDTLYTNKITPYSGTVINIQPTTNFNFLKSAGVNRVVFGASSTSGDILQIYRTGSDVPSNSFLYFNNNGSFGIHNNTVSKWNIDINGAGILASLNCGSGTIQNTGTMSCGNLNVSTSMAVSGDINSFANIASSGSISGNSVSAPSIICSGTITTNNLNPFSGTSVSSTGILNLNASNSSVIILNPITTTENRLQIFGVAAGTKYLYYNISNDLGVFNTTTGTSVWSISGSTGNISTIGTITYSEVIAPIVTTNLIRNQTFSTYRNSINLNELTTNPSISSINLNTVYVSLTTPANTINGASKYAFFKQETTGDSSFYINNIAGFVFQTNWSTRSVFSAYEWQFLSNSNGLRVHILSNATTAGDIMRIYRDAAGGSNFYFNQAETFGYKNNGGTTMFELSGNNGSAIFREFVQIQSEYVVNKQMLRFYNQTSAAIIGSVSMSSPSQVNYNTTSDYRLKQDIEPLKDSLERVMLLQPKTYRFKHDVEEGYENFVFEGFIAHEVQDIIPNIVSGDKDDPNIMQQMDYSKLTPLLTASIQELNNKVNKMQELIDSQQLLIQNLMERLDVLESK